MPQTRNKNERFRFKWSHQALPHRVMVKSINKVLSLIPFSIKYGIGKQFRKKQPPYNLINGKTVIQIGSPFDIFSICPFNNIFETITINFNYRAINLNGNIIFVT